PAPPGSVLSVVRDPARLGDRETRALVRRSAGLAARPGPRLLDLQARHLRYEGTPGLWHALLHALIRVGIPYSGMAVVGGLAAAAGASLLPRFSPFPALVRCLLPFTFFVSYQYAVLARSYNLLAPFLFGAAILFPRRRERPLAFAALLVLLSNASLHGFLIASGIGAVILRAWLIP